MPVERKHCQCRDTQQHFLQRLEQRLCQVYDSVRHRSTERGSNLRTAAYELAISPVQRAMMLRGF